MGQSAGLREEIRKLRVVREHWFAEEPGTVCLSDLAEVVGEDIGVSREAAALLLLEIEEEYDYPGLVDDMGFRLTAEQDAAQAREMDRITEMIPTDEPLHGGEED